MTAADLIRPLLSEYLDGELPAADAARVEAHLTGCSGCAAQLAQLRAASQALRSARQEPSAAALHAVRAQFRGALEEQAAGGGWSYRLLPQLLAAGMAAVLLIAAGAIMVPRMSRHESQQAKNGVVYIRPEESGSELDEKAAPAAAPVMAAPASVAASTPAPASVLGGAPAAAPPPNVLSADRAGPVGNYAPAPPAQAPRMPANAGEVFADADAERKKAKREAEQDAAARQNASAEKPKADASMQPDSRTAAGGARAGRQEERTREKDEPVDRSARYAAMPRVAITNLWVRGDGGTAATPSATTPSTDDRPAAAGAGHSAGTLAQADAAPGAAAAKRASGAPAGAPPASEPGLARRADCHPAPPEFPAFPGLHAGDADRLPLTVAVTIDGGGHVIKVEPQAGPAQMPLALEIRNWLRGQRVRPMICNGEGVAATLALTFTWPGE